MRRAVLILGGLLLAAMAGLAAIPAPDLPDLDPEAATVVRDRDGEVLRVFLPEDGRARMPVPLREVSPVFIKTLLASEDQRFYQHPGVDPLAVARAAWSNARAGRRVSGASTIAMQTARLAEPKARTWGGKIAEAITALRLTRGMDRDRLLETYVNLLPFGGNLVGVEAACRYYFGKAPAHLSLGESALLTAIPRAPNRFDPARHPEAAKKARDRVLDQLAARGVIDDEEARLARAEPMPRAKRPTPMKAPHFSRWAKTRFGHGRRIDTSLDSRLQALAEAQVARHIDGLRGQGLGNAAVVVLDVDTREVLAMVGSAGFFDSAHQGQVNCALARRNPGSALKPALYALAMDQGLISPGSMLLDVPVQYAGYAPENYDQAFHGAVSADLALSKSLNIPAVRLLAALGTRDFHTLLTRAGMDLKSPEHYGLSLALGSCETDLVRLTNLYATLADSGLHKPVRMTPARSDAKPTARRVLSPEASWLAMDMLTRTPRPAMAESWDLARGAACISWKTGTSHGHRDAWAVGATRSLAIGVWVGNPDGAPVKSISGTRHAAPLLFDLARALITDPEPAPPMPPGISMATVCAASRGLPTPACEHLVTIRTIPGKTTLKPCAWHKKIFVDKETGLRLGPACLASRPHREMTVTTPPAPLALWLAAQGAPAGTIPEEDPDCAAPVAAQAPKITSPDPTTVYAIRRGAPLEHQKVTLSAQAGTGARLAWYVDGVFVAEAGAGDTVFAALTPGGHHVSVVDQYGRGDGVDYFVE